ncbi:GNAT family N-acetyltransferase [Herbaspirillum autotrophicum]|uniref:GNAT family N-acetyltransferase n=1 Tax=Herbaspirillum autotrophicum TaxID=180195 RepID=UPI00067CB4B4|nr:GNAT family N-acetyltransferase [Herbaspirillum autotrophicum]
MTEIHHARFPQDLETVKDIFREYVGSATVSLEFQDYEAEFAALPGKYAAPQGRLLLAWRGERLVGCAALRQVDATTCEMKRVYVRPEARGEQLGRRLVERILDEARAAGYARICLDVLPEFTAAQQIYAALGFTDAPPVTFNPVPGTRFLALDL